VYSVVYSVLSTKTAKTLTVTDDIHTHSRQALLIRSVNPGGSGGPGRPQFLAKGTHPPVESPAIKLKYATKLQMHYKLHVWTQSGGMPQFGRRSNDS